MKRAMMELNQYAVRRKGKNSVKTKKINQSYLFQSIRIIAIQRGNASCVIGTTGSMGKLEELNYL